jgi:hypothetical protein
MSVTEWIYLTVATIALVWAVVATKVASNYRHQIDNVQQAASNARDQASTQRHVSDALAKVVRAYEALLIESRRRADVVEGMNRMLVAAQPKPRVRRTPAVKKEPTNVG